MIRTFDVAIVGAGPAGTAAACKLAQAGCRVGVFEARSTPHEFRCGETLAGHALQVLEKLGVAQWFDAAKQIPSHGVEVSWGAAKIVFTPSITNPHGGGFHIARASFERKLEERALEHGVQLRHGARLRAIERTRSGFSACFECKSQSTRDTSSTREVIEASYVIDASGRSCAVARRLGSLASRFDEQIALVGWLAPVAGRAALPACLLLEAREAGWWYTVPLPDGFSVSAFVCDPVRSSDLTPSARWHAELAKTLHTGRRVNGYALKHLEVVACGSSKLDVAGGMGWIALGDAAMTYDPLSAQGPDKALRAGVDFASQFAARGATGFAVDEYQARCDEEFSTYRKTLRWFHAQEQRWRGAPFWLNRHRSS
jgi:flavin-dependent dehydrogenase